MKKVSSFLLSLGLIVVLLSVGVLSGCAAGAKEPTVTGVNPSSAEVGETLDVAITGTDLSGTSAVSFGAGITVNSFTVDSATKITAGISISSGGTVGSRDVSVTTPGGTGTKTGGFGVTFTPEIPRISVEEVKTKLDAGSNIVIVDVRSTAAYESASVLEAIHIPLSDLSTLSSLSSEEINQRYGLIRSVEIITYCD
jgi:hypothetical protein